VLFPEAAAVWAAARRGAAVHRASIDSAVIKARL